MHIENIKKLLSKSIDVIANRIDEFVMQPGQDFVRSRKLPAATLLLLLIAMRTKAAGSELANFFDELKKVPSVSALCQQRNKLKAQALREIFLDFTSGLCDLWSPVRYDIPSGWQYIAADGTRLSFPVWQNKQYSKWVRTGKGKPYHEGHLTATWDIERKIFLDGCVQPIHEMDERRAFCTLIDRFQKSEDVRTVFIADRGFASWNTAAHAMESGNYFLIRTKDLDVARGILWCLPVSKTDTLDEWVDVEIIRRSDREAALASDHTRILIPQNRTFDYAEGNETYKMKIRVSRFELPNGEYECVISNLPDDEFPIEKLPVLYSLRWGIEIDFSFAKDHLSFESLHSCKPEFVKQEIWGSLTAFNFISCLKLCADIEIAAIESVPKKKPLKYHYEANFSTAVTLGIPYLISSQTKPDPDLLSQLVCSRHPIRPGRIVPHGKPRKGLPRSLNHRAA